MGPAASSRVSASVRPWLLARPLSTPGLIAGLFVAYVTAGLAGIEWSHAPVGVALVWVPPGLALGAFLILGYRIWPVVSAAAVVVFGWTLGFDPAVPLLAAGHTAEPLLAAYLVNRYANGRHALQEPRSSVRFFGLVVLAAAASGATLTAAALVVTGRAAPTDYGLLYLAQGLGSMTGMLLVAPPIVLFSRSRPLWRIDQIVEACAAFVVASTTGLVGFYRFPIGLRGFPVELLLMPVLIWPALRLGRRATAATLLLLAVLVTGGTLEGYGPFVRSTPFTSLTIVLLFLSASAALTLPLSALASDYAVAESQLRELVVTDPMTGLPNYRRLVEVLSGRSRGRTVRTARLRSCSSTWTA